MLAGSEKTLPPVKRSLRILLESLVDYAGLFPPAALPMGKAVENYARYREGDYAWMLGRFIVQAAHMHEVPKEFPMSVIASPDSIPHTDVVELTGAPASGRLARRPPAPVIYVETKTISGLTFIQENHLRAKIRTGGITHDAFPNVEFIANFLRECESRHIAFKATAGLHHPIRCHKPLTYEANAPTGTMYGFINLFMAAGLTEHAEEILKEEEPHAFEFDEHGAAWRGHHINIDGLHKLRKRAVSFGSCSFDEPIADLQELGWL
jgi:hypothetical protein